MSRTIEYKRFDIVPQNVSEKGAFDGHLAVYGNVDAYKDIILPGAATKSIENSGGKVPMLYQHDPRLSVGLMHLTDTPDAVDTHSVFNLDKQLAKDVYSDVKFYQENGKPLGLSIGFFVDGKDGAEIDEKTGVRYLKRIEIVEGSVVTFPANDMARITGVKSILTELAEGVTTIREFEEFLRESGFSKREAIALASHGWKDFRRDADESHANSKLANLVEQTRNLIPR